MRAVGLFGLGILLLVLGVSATAWAQATAAFPSDPPVAQAPAPAPAPAPPAAPAPAAPAPAGPAPAPVAPAEAPPPAPPSSYTPPPGYKLVPIESPAEPNVWAPPRVGYPPLELPYSDGQTVPPGYEVVSRNRFGLILAGTITTGVMWFFSITATVMSQGHDQTGYLVIPVLGPWLMLATGGGKDECTTSGDFVSCTDNSSVRGLVVFDGLIQLGGAAMFASGFLFPSKHLVRTAPTVGIRPMTFGRDGHGLGLLGSF